MTGPLTSDRLKRSKSRSILLSTNKEIFAHICACGRPPVELQHRPCDDERFPSTSMLVSSLARVSYLVDICAHSRLLYYRISVVGYLVISIWARNGVMIPSR